MFQTFKPSHRHTFEISNFKKSKFENQAIMEFYPLCFFSSESLMCFKFESLKFETLNV